MWQSPTEDCTWTLSTKASRLWMCSLWRRSVAEQIPGPNQRPGVLDSGDEYSASVICSRALSALTTSNRWPWMQRVAFLDNLTEKFSIDVATPKKKTNGILSCQQLLGRLAGDSFEGWKESYVRSSIASDRRAPSKASQSWNATTTRDKPFSWV